MKQFIHKSYLLRIFTGILLSITWLNAPAIYAVATEYKMSSDDTWGVVNDHAVMKEKNTIEIQFLDNDRLPADYTVKVESYTNNTSFKNTPAIIGNYKLKFHQPQNTGIDTVYYAVCEEGGECLQAMAIFQVVKNEDKPTAARDVVITDKNAAVEIDVFKNDYGNNSVKLAVINDSKFGKHQINGKKIKYTPENGFLGVDSLTYQVCDGNCSSNKMVIYVIGKDQPPVVSDIDLITDEDEEFNFDLNILKSGYSDPAKLSLRELRIVSLPKHGILYVKSSEASLLQEVAVEDFDKIKYVPNPDYYGDDLWQWNGSNGVLYAEKVAKIKFSIKPVNDAPQANADIARLDEDSSILIDVLANDVDVDGDPLTISAIDHPQNVGEFKIENNKIAYTPNLNYHGTFTFTYSVTDGKEISSAEVEVTVKSVNDIPSVSDFQVDLDENDEFVFSVEIFENHFSDPDHSNLQKIKIIQLPSQGQLFLFNQPVNSSREVIFNDLDNLKYVPEKGFTGKDKIIYNASDGIDYANLPANLWLNVIDINFVPEARDDNGITTPEDTPIIIDVMANDTDEDGDKLTVTKVSAITTGTLEITPEEQILFVPALNYSGSFTFEYTITDEAGATDKANVNVIVVEENDRPVLEEFSVELIQNTSYHFSVQQFLDRYNDVETSEFNSLIIEQLPAYGSLELQGMPLVAGQEISPFALDDLEYIPQKNYIGNDIFYWNASDGQLSAENASLVEITIRRYTGQIHAFKAISPNGDGKNDEWIIEGIDMFPNNTLILFDRSGNRIIEISGYDNQQNVWRGELGQLGSFNLVKDGTYYYRLDLGDGINSYKGYIIVQK